MPRPSSAPAYLSGVPPFAAATFLRFTPAHRLLQRVALLFLVPELREVYAPHKKSPRARKQRALSPQRKR